MKNTLLTFAVSLLTVCSAFADFNTPSYVNSTNASGVQLLNVAGGTNQPNVLLANTTNFFNLSTAAGTTNNPNLWPAQPIIAKDNVFNPSRWVSWNIQSLSMAANVGVWQERYAGSIDGVHWQTNPCPLIISSTQAGGAMSQVLTNVDTGGIQYWCIYDRENTNGSVAITNIFESVGFNRGL